MKRALALVVSALALEVTATNVVMRCAADLANKTSGRGESDIAFELEGVISYPVSDGNDTFGVIDASGAVILKRIKDHPLPPIHAGDRCRMSGVTHPDAFACMIACCTNLVVLSSGPAPDPLPVSAAQIQSGLCDNRFIRLTGTVRDAFVDEIDPKWAYVTVHSGDGLFYVTYKSFQIDLGEFERMIGAEVSVDALCFPNAGGHRMLLGRILKIYSTAAIRILRTPQRGPFDVPELEDRCHLDSTNIRALGRRRISGIVLAVWQGVNLLVRDPTGDLFHVILARQDPPTCGSSIDVIGLPETDFYRINLSRATWRPSSVRHPSPEGPPEPVSVRRLMTDEQGRQKIDVDYHGRHIRITGIVRSLPDDGSRCLHLESDQFLIPVDASNCPTALDGICVGSTVEASGICIMETESGRQTGSFPHIRGFSIVLRDAQGLKTVSRPSWWTPHRLLMVIGALLVSLLGILFWNTVLRRIVTRKGRELMREQLGHVTAELKTEERTRLAVELHDSLAQNLTGVSLEIDTAAKVADENPAAMKEHLSVAARSLKSCRDELRNCLWDLRNRALEERTMDEAIRQTLAPHVAGVAVAVRFNVPRERISDNTAHAILRIIRELTLNGIRHGGATKIRIAGSVEGERMLFSVRDNGCGFDPAAAPGFSEGHYGLVGIRERVDEFEGDFELVSAPGKGTKATVSLRVPQENRQT